MNIVLLSDLHISRKNNHLAITSELIAKINNLSNVVVIITGDLIDQAKDLESMFELKRELNKLNKRLLLVAGNHDYYANFGNEFSYCKNCVETFNQVFFDNKNVDYPISEIIDNILFIGINTNHHDYFATGRIGKKQMIKIKSVLNSVSARTADRIIIYMHHHPFRLKKWYQLSLFDVFYERFMRLEDSEEFMSLIKGKVDIVLFGHRHSWLGTYKRNDILFVNSGSSTEKKGVTFINTNSNKVIKRIFS